MSALSLHTIFSERHSRKFKIIFCSLILWFQSFAAFPQASEEYQLKAVFIYNFTHFIQWPESAFLESDSPFVIGVIGNNVFENHLQEAVAGERVGNHPLVVRLLDDPSKATECHMIFIERSYALADHVIKKVKGKPVLTMSDHDNFMKRAGMLRLYLEDKKVRLQINQKLTDESDLTVSSKLLRLAEIYRKD